MNNNISKLCEQNLPTNSNYENFLPTKRIFDQTTYSTSLLIELSAQNQSLLCQLLQNSGKFKYSYSN